MGNWFNMIPSPDVQASFVGRDVFQIAATSQKVAPMCLLSLLHSFLLFTILSQNLLSACSQGFHLIDLAHDGDVKEDQNDSLDSLARDL